MNDWNQENRTAGCLGAGSSAARRRVFCTNGTSSLQEPAFADTESVHNTNNGNSGTAPADTAPNETLQANIGSDKPSHASDDVDVPAAGVLPEKRLAMGMLTRLKAMARVNIRGKRKKGTALPRIRMTTWW